MRERRNTRGTEEILQYIMVFRRIVCICAVVFICIVGKRCIVQAAEYDYPIERTREVQVLDEACKDSQGVKYTLDEATHTAMVGEQTASTQTPCDYQGANGGVCVVPEQVSKNDIVYTVTSIARQAFYHNSYLKTLVVADTVEKIEALAIRDSYIRHIYIGTGVKEIVNAANMFAGSSFLEDITVSDENTMYKDQDGILFTKDGKTLLCAPRLLPGNSLTVYTVPDGVEVIGTQAFNKTRYRKIVLPESVKKIETEAFENGYLTEIDLSHVNELGSQIFAGCKYLQNIVFPDSAWKVWGAGWTLFGDGVNNVQFVYLKKDLTYGSYNHANCFRLENLKTLVVENGITVIGKSEFQYTNLETVILPDGLKKIEENAFRNDSLLKRIYIPASVTSIGNNVLADNDTIIYGVTGSVAQSYAEEHDISFIDVSDHDHANMPNKTVYEDLYTKVTADYCTECGYGTNVKQENKAHEDIVDGTNGAYDFSLEKTRKKVKLDASLKDEQGVKYILYEDSNVAYVDKIANDVNTKHVVIPEVVIWNNREYIVTTLFQSCIVSSSIETITLPDTIWQIYDQAFSSYSLKYIYLGAGVGNTALGMFYDKKNINGIWIAPGNAGYYVKDKVLYKNDGTVLCDYSGNTESSETTTEKTTLTEKPTEKDTSIEKTTTTEKDTGVENPTTEKNTSVEKTTTEKNTSMERPTTTEKATSIENPTPPMTEKDVSVGNTNPTETKNVVQSPTLKVKKKKISTGQPYLRISLKKIKGTYIELQVKKAKGKFKKVKLVSNRLKHYKGELKIGYNPDGKKMWLRIRTYTKKKGKKYYSAWSKPVLVK